MLSFGTLAFTNPWVLGILALLPGIWFLARITPPAPRQLPFPAIRLLHTLPVTDDTPANTPLWLVILRILVAALIVTGLAGPVMNPDRPLPGQGPVVLVIDDGWAAAADWEVRREAAMHIVSQAERENVPVILMTTAPALEMQPHRRARDGSIPSVSSPEATPVPDTAALLPAFHTPSLDRLHPADARARLTTLQPKPWDIDRGRVLAALGSDGLGEPARVFWFSNGLEIPLNPAAPADGVTGTGKQPVSATMLAERLQRLGTTTLLEPPRLPLLLTPTPRHTEKLVVSVRRPALHTDPDPYPDTNPHPDPHTHTGSQPGLGQDGSGGAPTGEADDKAGDQPLYWSRPTSASLPLRRETLFLQARTATGRMLARDEVVFPAGRARIDHVFDFPGALANDIAQIALENRPSAGSVLLMDEKWQRHPVGLVATTAFAGEQPLLDELHYLRKALAPFAEVHQGPVATLLDANLPVIILPDHGLLQPEEQNRLVPWLAAGGVLIRFAGPKLGAIDPTEADQLLVPVPLRQGGRLLGGTLTWSEPARLAPFAADSPFAGITIPEDVIVYRQVLAEPSVDLTERTWAHLEDGTPLVTTAQRGRGWLVLVHSTAEPSWSTLSLSGLFVELLRRLTTLARGGPDPTDTRPLSPLLTLDGFGRLGAPPVSAGPLLPADLHRLQLAAEPLKSGPPLPVGPTLPPGYYGTGEARRALNIGSFSARLQAIGPLPRGIERRRIGVIEEQRLGPWLLIAAFMLLIVETAMSLALRNILPGRSAMPRSKPTRSRSRSRGRGRNKTLPDKTHPARPWLQWLSRSGLIGLIAMTPAWPAAADDGTSCGRGGCRHERVRSSENPDPIGVEISARESYDHKQLVQGADFRSPVLAVDAHRPFQVAQTVIHGRLKRRLMPAPMPDGRTPEDLALLATLETRLAYVVTGIQTLDRISLQGLTGLTEALSRRTAVEPAAPIGVDLEKDELAFFPLLYWPISRFQPNLSFIAIRRLNRFMQTGGTILFDTLDQALAMANPDGFGPGTRRLREILADLELPPLQPVPDNHVLTRAFYLMKEWPGRYTGGTVWVELADGRDEVSSLIVGSHDWAGAWAIDSFGQPLYPVVPNGERQREQALRFGINVVMYALTGNYKTDQVHVRTILERLGG